MQKDIASLKREQSKIREEGCERKPCLNLLRNENGLWVLNGKFVFLLPSQIHLRQSAAEYKRGCVGPGRRASNTDIYIVFLKHLC